MKKILKLASKYETFLNSGIANAIVATFKNNEAIFLELNSEDQLYERGVDNQNKALASREPYEPITISIKREKGQPTNRVTLRDSGDFHDSFYLSFKGETIEVRASDWKFGELVDKYGPIMGWTDDNLQDITQNYLLPSLLKALPS